MYMSQKNKKVSAGFTLIELMVSLTVFAIVMVVSTSTLLTMVNANAKAQALYSATSNLSFALDSMTREMRMGYHYFCKNTDGSDEETVGSTNSASDCASGNFIAFTRERDDVRMGYRLVGGKIQQKISGSWSDITADDVVIDTFLLEVDETDVEDDGNIKQPSANITIKGYVNNGLDTNTDFHIQTHVVQRRLDLL